MRLIDADKLPYVSKIILVDKLDGDIIITIAKEYTSYVNDETPTVEAIPIKWMYEWRMKNNEQYNVGVSSFSQMISDWEKENERLR